jgi:hypothetical protein
MGHAKEKAAIRAKGSARSLSISSGRIPLYDAFNRPRNRGMTWHRCAAILFFRDNQEV